MDWLLLCNRPPPKSVAWNSSSVSSHNSWVDWAQLAGFSAPPGDAWGHHALTFSWHVQEGHTFSSGSWCCSRLGTLLLPNMSLSSSRWLVSFLTAGRLGSKKMKTETASSLKAWAWKFQNITLPHVIVGQSKSQGQSRFKGKGKRPHHQIEETASTYKIWGILSSHIWRHPTTFCLKDFLHVSRVVGMQCSHGFLIGRNFCLGLHLSFSSASFPKHLHKKWNYCRTKRTSVRKLVEPYLWEFCLTSVLYEGLGMALGCMLSCCNKDQN